MRIDPPLPEPVSIPARFCGPPGIANGGYTAGLLAGAVGGCLEVTLRRPPPLDRHLTIRRDGEGATLMDGDAAIAEARSAALVLDVPIAIDLDAACRASTRYAGFAKHPFPRCFVCGVERDQGDGLRIFPGPVDDTAVLAAPWVPGDSLPPDTEEVPPEWAWAALDCAGAWATWQPDGPAILLGRITARVDRGLSPRDNYVVIGWPISVDGRKRDAGTAVLTSSGEIAAAARSTWVTPAS